MPVVKRVMVLGSTPRRCQKCKSGIAPVAVKVSSRARGTSYYHPEKCYKSGTHLT